LRDAFLRALARVIFAECGEGIIIKQNCYFGRGDTLRVGANSQLGANARIDPYVTIGDDVVMGPDVVIETISHAFDQTDLPMRLQGASAPRPVVVGNDVWIGTRVIILPGVSIGSHSIVGANAVVTRDIPPYSVAAGVPCRVIHMRNTGVSLTAPS
jgi:maltose O-acetyltransferase